MARRISNDGSDGRDAYARMQMYNDERRAVAAQQRAVGNWSVEGGRGGIAASQRNMSNQGSLKDMWRNGRIVRGGIAASQMNMSNQGSLKDMWRNGRIAQPGTGGQTPTGTQPRNTLNPAKTSTATSTAGTDSGWDYTPTANNPFGRSKTDTVGSVMSGLSSVGALSKTFAGEASSAIGALSRLGKPLFVYSPEGQKTTSIIPDGSPSAGAIAFGRGIYYKPPEGAGGVQLPALTAGSPQGLSNEESSRNRVLNTPDTLSQVRSVLQSSFSTEPKNDIGIGGTDDYFTERIRRLNYPKGQ